MASSSSKKLPRMYTKTDEDKVQIKLGDVDSVKSADPMISADYDAQDKLLTGVLRKKGMPSRKGK